MAAATPFKVRNCGSKWLLRQVLNLYVPPTLVERPKMGFGVPIGTCLRGRLRNRAKSLLSPQRFGVDGILRPEPIPTAWREHLEGSRSWQYSLWTGFMLQAWRQQWA